MKDGDAIEVTNEDGSKIKAEFVSRTGGWTQYYTGDGTLRKARNSAVKALSVDKGTSKVVELSGSKNPDTTTNEEQSMNTAATTGKTTDPLKSARSRYTKSRIGEGKNSRLLIDNNDDTAQKLRGADLEDVYKQAAEAKNTTVAELKEKYKHLNNGLQRMSLGNIIRAASKPKVEKPKKTKAPKAAEGEAAGETDGGAEATQH